MDLSFYEFLGDGVGNDDIVESVKAFLENKYQIKVVPDRIGNRFGHDEDDVVTVYYHPEGEEAFIFSVKYNLEAQTYSDDYLYRKVCCEIEKAINSVISKANIQSMARVEMISKNSLEEDLSVKDFAIKYPGITFLSYIVINREYDETLITNTLNELISSFDNVPNINSYLFFAESAEYEEAQKEITDLEYFSKSMLSNYFEKEPAIYRIENKKIIKVK